MTEQPRQCLLSIHYRKSYVVLMVVKDSILFSGFTLGTLSNNILCFGVVTGIYLKKLHFQMAFVILVVLK